MKLIDEKGRLFGKINIIDFLVILFFISLTPMAYYGYKIFSTPPPPPPPPQKQVQDYQSGIQIYVLFKNLSEDIVKVIAVNDRELNKDGQVIAEIISIEKVEPNILVVVGGQKEPTSVVDNTKKQVLVKMLINANVTANNQILYKGEVISDNRLIKFETDKYTINGMITPPPRSEEVVYYDTDVVFRNVPESIVKMIKVGDKEMDYNNRIVAEIIDITNSESEYYQIEYSISGVKQKEVLETADKKRVKARMRLLVEPQFDNSVTFKDRKIEPEQTFYFKTNKYSIRGVFSPPPPPPQKQVVLRVRLDNVIPEVYRFIKGGDVMKILRIKESTINPQPLDRLKEKDYIKIAEIKRIISMENVKREFYSLKRDELIQFDHPYLKNMVLEIEALCYEEGGQHIFNGSSVRLGSSFTFQNEDYQISGVIIEMNRG